MPADLDRARYIAFGTYRADGSLKSTPTWVTPFRDGYAFTTDPSSFKVKRLRANPNVVITVSNISGKVSADATAHHGAATLLDASETDEVDKLIRAKYRIQYPLLISTGAAWRRLRGKTPAESVGVLVQFPPRA